MSLLAAAQHWGDAPADSWMTLGWSVLRRMETAFRLASVINLYIFLSQGTYRFACLATSMHSQQAHGVYCWLTWWPDVHCHRSLVHRLLAAQLVYEKAVMSRGLSFEYLNSQLVWHELSELLLFVLPLVDITRLKRVLRNHVPALAVTLVSPAWAGNCPPADPCLYVYACWPAISERVHVSSSGADNNNSSSSSGSNQEAAAADPTCTACGVNPSLLPYEALPCHHRYCYYCLRSRTSRPDLPLSSLYAARGGHECVCRPLKQCEF